MREPRFRDDPNCCSPSTVAYRLLLQSWQRGSDCPQGQRSPGLSSAPLGLGGSDGPGPPALGPVGSWRARVSACLRVCVHACEWNEVESYAWVFPSKWFWSAIMEKKNFWLKGWKLSKYTELWTWSRMRPKASKTLTVTPPHSNCYSLLVLKAADADSKVAIENWTKGSSSETAESRAAFKPEGKWETARATWPAPSCATGTSRSLCCVFGALFRLGSALLCFLFAPKLRQAELLSLCLLWK